MTAFWIAAGFLTALVLVALCWPLLRRRQATHASRKAINTAIYRDQMAELERDLASGALSQADHAAARDELERRVLEDVAADDAAAPAEAPRRLSRTAAVLAVALPVAAISLYFVLGTPAALDPTAQQAAPTADEIEKMVATLAAKLEKNPDNPQGWVMLGRSYKALGRFDDAARAFDKAGPAMESEPELMLEVAELSAEINQGKIEGKGLELLRQVLKDQPDNPQALVLAGTDAYFRQNYADAVRHWERVLAQVAPDSQDAQNLSAGIDKAIADVAFTQVKTVIRANYSNPPSHGAAVVTTIVSDPALYAEWVEEVAAMRVRIREMRELLVEKLAALGVSQDFSFIREQNGMFSFSGLSKDQVERLKSEFAIYIVGSGRISVAGITRANIDPLCDAIAKVL